MFNDNELYYHFDTACGNINIMVIINLFVFIAAPILNYAQIYKNKMQKVSIKRAYCVGLFSIMLLVLFELILGSNAPGKRLLDLKTFEPKTS